MAYEFKGSDSMKMLRDWRQARESPPSYRFGKRTLRMQAKFITIFVTICIILFCIRYFIWSGSSHKDERCISNSLLRPDTGAGVSSTSINICSKQYNSTYPLTRPRRTPEGFIYKIAVVSDLDANSKSTVESNSWISYLRTGYLTWNPSMNSVRISWDEGAIQLKSSLSQGGRGMELSELVVFDGKLFTVDDRTGVVYEISGNKVIPWVILPDGDGKISKGFKCEWATVKNQNLIVGGFGKEWTNFEGKLINFNPQWIKSISNVGEVSHKNWRDNYVALLKAVGASYPGYMIHEAVMWSDIHKKWFFLPRRFSRETYHEETDELMGTNLLLTSDENFQNIKVSKVGDVYPSHGFSSFKFIPGSEDEVVIAIKSEELKGSISSYAIAFKLNGKILMPETKIGDIKFEGIEFI